MAFDYFTESRWNALWVSLGSEAPKDSFQRLSTLYGEPHRHYHGSSHIDRCLATLEGLRGCATSASWVELALWLHDSIYDTRRHDNEHRSALYASGLLAAAGLADLSAEVSELIMATTHNPDRLSGDTALLVGIDLSILGSSQEDYRCYTAAVRREYSWVSDEAFRLGRLKLLESFLQRARIFDHPACFDLWERSARANIEEEIESLSR